MYSLSSGCLSGGSLSTVVAVVMVVVTVVMGLTNFELLIELPSGRWCTIAFDQEKINNINNVYSLSAGCLSRRSLGAVMAVVMVMVTVVVGLTNLKLVYELPCGRWSTIAFD